MKHILKTTGVAVCGLLTSLLTALLVAFVEHLTGFDIFTLTIWFVVPIGAIVTGCAAASGYYFGSLFFHTRPNILLFVQMVVVAGLTQLLIYYLEYATLVLDDGRRVSNAIPFRQYLDISLTSAHYRMGRAAQIDSGEIGQLGYWLAAIQFVGFLFGGLGAFGILCSHPVCAGCKKYMRALSKTDKTFANSTDLAAYHDSLFELPVESEKFAELAAVEHTASVVKGACRLRMTLYGCPACKAQTLGTELSVWRGQDWKTIDKLGRKDAVPAGGNLLAALKSKA